MVRTHKAPGRAHREGLSIIELMKIFPNEEAATKWFEDAVWAGGRCCGKCGSINTREVPNAKPMPYWCTDCRGYFSVRTGTAIARSNVPLRKWAIAIYLCLTSLKSVSSMKLHRDLGVSQKTAWFMLHRIREAWASETSGAFAGLVEADETFVGSCATRPARHCADSSRSTPQMTRWSTPMGKPDMSACLTMKRSGTRSASMSGVRRTPTGWSRSGQCSSGRTWERSTSSARST